MKNILDNKLTSDFPTSENSIAVSSHGRVNINVPFSEKEEAKRLGAKWDRYKKTWYAPEGQDMNVFRKWLDVPNQLTESEIRMQFANALQDAGLIVKGELVMDGTWHRTTVSTSSKTKALKGAYIAQLGDIERGKPASGYIQNFDTGFATAWYPKGQHLSRSTYQQFKEQAEENHRLHEQELMIERERVAKQSQEKWNALSEAVAHPYLEKKQVKSFGLKLDGSSLVTPLMDENGKIWSLQYISDKPNQIKLYEKGGHKTGHFYVLGNIESSPIVLFGEGYATCASLHMATGLPVVQTFDSGNIQSVLSVLKPHLQSKTLVICADDDSIDQECVFKKINNLLASDHLKNTHSGESLLLSEVAVDGVQRELSTHPGYRIRLEYTDGVQGMQRISGELDNPEKGVHIPILINNVGREKALDAGVLHQAHVIFPKFTSSDGRPTDFNDLHVREGLNKVKMQVESALEKIFVHLKSATVQNSNRDTQFVNRMGKPFYIASHAEDTGHTVVFGAAGGGKSFMLNTMVKSEYSQDKKIDRPRKSSSLSL